MDVKVTRRRSFVYVTFRMEDEQEYEELYLRPHKSGLPDAVQYAPGAPGPKRLAASPRAGRRPRPSSSIMGPGPACGSS